MNIWDRIVVGAPDACWLWTARVRKGYGVIKVRGKNTQVTHLVLGVVPAGSVVRHTCDNPRCCNPRHLVLGTQLQNVQDRVSRGRCARGERNGRARLTADQVREIRGFYAVGGWRQQDLADAYGVSANYISELLAGKKWASDLTTAASSSTVDEEGERCSTPPAAPPDSGEVREATAGLSIGRGA